MNLWNMRIFLSIFTSFIALAGCSSRSWNNEIRTSESFNDKEDSAIVIMGQFVRDYLDKNSCKFETIWKNYDERGDKIVIHEFSNVKTGCGIRGDGIKYSIFKIIPGRYILALAKGGGTNSSYYTSLISPSGASQFSEFSSPKFEVKKGEVIYIGDYIFDKPYPARLKVVERHDNHATNAVHENSKIKDDFSFRSTIQ